MKTMSKCLYIASVLLIFIGLDQVTKAMARMYLANSPAYSYLGDMFRLQYAENPGVFLSLGASLSAEARFWLFTLLTGIFLTGMLIYLIRKDGLDRFYIGAFSLIIAGGIGNLIDRIVFNGVVTDFINIGFGNLRTGIFNIADVAIMFGAGMLMLDAFKAQAPTESPKQPYQL